MPIKYSSPRRLTRPSPNGATESGTAISRLIGSSYPYTETGGNYARSMSAGGGKRRINLNQLRALSDTAPAQICITHVIDGVVAMRFEVVPPERLKNDIAAKQKAERIMRAITSPNKEEQPNYTMFASAIITDLLIGNVAAIERQFQALPDEPDPDPIVEDSQSPSPEYKKLKQEVWQWAIDYARIQLNKDWTPQTSDTEPRYYDRGPTLTADKDKWEPLMDWELYTIQRYSNTWRIRPPSPLEIAYEVISSWLGLSTYQSSTTSKAHQEFMIDLGPVSDAELKQFREFFRVEVQGHGQTPIIGTKGGGLNVVKIGATSDDGLYLKYEEKILRLIALVFKLSPRDMNITEPDNRATAGVSADASFQKAILPMANTILEAFQTQVVDFYYPGYRLRFIDSEPRNEAEESTTAGELFEKDIITLNEARVRAKEDRIDPARGSKFKSELAPAAPAPGAAPGGGEPAPDGKQPGTPPKQPKQGAFSGKTQQLSLFH
jgi:Phage portal protein